MMGLPKKQGDSLPLTLATASKNPKAYIFLSWGGEIYGPATPEEVANGIRTSWFEQGALYWHEGLDEWKPICEFAIPGKPPTDWRMRKTAVVPSAPNLPEGPKRDGDRIEERRRPQKPQRPSRQLDLRGRVIFFGIALLAVLLTVGILLLLMRV